MTLLQLTYFMTVAEKGSFTGASKALFVSTPAVSKRISELEAELGVPLFTGDNRHRTLTDEGQTLFAFLRRTAAEFDDCVNAMRGALLGKTSRLRISCSTSWDTDLFIPRIRALAAEYMPQLELEFLGTDAADIFEEVERLDSDIALDISHPNPDPEKFRIRPFTAVPYLLLYSASHPLAGKEDLSIADFRDSYFYVPEAPDSFDKETPGTLSISRITEEICRSCGFSPRLFSIANSHEVFFNIQICRGVTLLSNWFRKPSSDHFRLLDTGYCYDVHFLYSKHNTNPNIEPFIALMQEKY